MNHSPGRNAKDHINYRVSTHELKFLKSTNKESSYPRLKLLFFNLRGGRLDKQKTHTSASSLPQRPIRLYQSEAAKAQPRSPIQVSRTQLPELSLTFLMVLVTSHSCVRNWSCNQTQALPCGHRRLIHQDKYLLSSLEVHNFTETIKLFYEDLRLKLIYSPKTSKTFPNFSFLFHYKIQHTVHQFVSSYFQ